MSWLNCKEFDFATIIIKARRMATAQKMMRVALACAQDALEQGEIPVGAVLCRNGSIVAKAHNQTKGNQSPLEHAEYLVLKAAFKELGRQYLTDCTLYVTLEPCAMCAGAISLARVGRLYFGAYDPKSGGTDHGARVFDHPQCHWKPEVYGGILESDCRALLAGFFATKR